MENALLVTPEENKSSLVNGLIKFLNNYIKYDLNTVLEIGDEIPINGNGQHIILDKELNNALNETFDEVENKINKQKIKSRIPNEILVTLTNKIYSNNIKIKTSKNPELESLTLYDVVELLDHSYDYPINAGDHIKLKSGIIEITEEFYNTLKKEIYDYEKKNIREKEFKENYNEKEIQIIDEWETVDTKGMEEILEKLLQTKEPQSKNLKRASDNKKSMTKSLTELFTLDELINKLTDSNIDLDEEIKGHAVTSQDLKNFKEELRTYGISFKKLKESMSVYSVKGGKKTLTQKIENFYSNKNPATKGSKFDALYERIDKTKEVAMKALKNLTELEGILNKTAEYKAEHQEVNKLINEYEKLDKVNDYTPLTGIKDYLNNLSNKVIEVGEDNINLDSVINSFENQISTIEKNISNLDNEISEIKKIKISYTPKLNENLKNILDKCYNGIKEITEIYNRINKKMEKLDNIYESKQF